MKIYQIVEEGFLELINNILTVGLVPALFTDEEKDGIINACRSVAEEEGYSASKYTIQYNTISLNVVYLEFLVVEGIPCGHTF